MTLDDQNARDETRLERRTALRRGAAVLAGVAGLGVAATATAPPAGAAAGDPVLQGSTNNAGGVATTLTSTSASPSATLQLANTGSGAPLRVAASTTPPQDTSVAGDHRSVDLGTGEVLPSFTHVTGTGSAPAAWGFVLTDISAFQPLPVTPQRALDTRFAARRVRVIDPAGKFDSAGRLIGGKTITLSLADYVFGFGGVFGNLTVTGSLLGGYLTLYPADPWPGVSSINFTKGQTLANFSFTGMHFTGTDDTVRIFATSTTHVIFDVTGFAVGSADFLNPAILPAASAPAVARTGAIDLSRAPAWFQRRQADRGRSR